MTDDFAPDGQLAKAIPGFKPREPQRQMAVAVTQAIEKGQPLVVEAGTGTGKTYAYLAPALRAKKKVIISTGSKALQDQQSSTASELAQIDAVLEKQGSNKSSILDATIFLADKNDFAAMNKAWDAWVVAGHAPVRCTVQAGLMNPKYKVEIKIVAAV